MRAASDPEHADDLQTRFGERRQRSDEEGGKRRINVGTVLPENGVVHRGERRNAIEHALARGHVHLHQVVCDRLVGQPCEGGDADDHRDDEQNQPTPSGADGVSHRPHDLMIVPCPHHPTVSMV